MPPLQDYKRIGEGDEGENTGGMGAIGPVYGTSRAPEDFLQQLEARVFEPVLHAMRRQGRPFRGLLFAGLLSSTAGDFVLEFNARFGDPETQALLLGLCVDLYPLLYQAAIGGALAASGLCKNQLRDMLPTAAVVLASKGYPGSFQTDQALSVLAEEGIGQKVFYAGVRAEGQRLYTSGGRVLSAVCSRTSHEEALKGCYQMIENIYFEGMTFRRDIGSNRFFC